MGYIPIRNLELEAKQRQLEAHRESLTTAESRRIAQLFKRKYESEIANLQAKLNKYVKQLNIKQKTIVF